MSASARRKEGAKCAWCGEDLDYFNYVQISTYRENKFDETIRLCLWCWDK